MIDATKPANFLIDPPRWRIEVFGYGVATSLVAAFFVGLLAILGRALPDQEPSDVDSAVMIDLPAADASANPPSDVRDSPIQQPPQTSVAQSTPEEMRLPDTPTVAQHTKVDLASEAPPVPEPTAVVPAKQKTPRPPPKRVVAPSVAPQDASAPAGAAAPNKADDGDAGRPHASAHAITLWQKSLMRRLETAKRSFARPLSNGGTAHVAFEIDGKGNLASERIVESSGSANLDEAALALVKRAAPFPRPPAGVGSAEMSFIVPIRFRR